MPRNLAIQEKTDTSQTPAAAPIENAPLKTAPNPSAPTEPSEEPSPLPSMEAHSPTGTEEEREQADQEGVIHIKTLHLVSATALISFFLGALTLFFIHPIAGNSLGQNQSALNDPDALAQNPELNKLKAQIESQNQLIDKLKNKARTRIALPAQTNNPLTPDRITYTQQDGTTATDWIRTANADITWLSNAPLNPEIIAALNAKKTQNFSILVIAGSQALLPNLSRALHSGYTVYQSKLPLADATSVLIIDSKLVVDVSNSDFVWATAEPTVVKDITTYAISVLLKDANHLFNSKEP